MWDRNAYYNPSALGLTVIAEVEYSDQNYCYDTRVVWQHEDGAFYTARDSGCSCPTPFEDYTSVESLERVDIRALEREVEEERRSSWGNPDIDRESREFLKQVRAALG